MFGGKKVGGIRVSHLSHIDKPVTENLTVTRGRREAHTVEPLSADVQIAALRDEWKSAAPDRKKAIEAEVAELSGGAK